MCGRFEKNFLVVSFVTPVRKSLCRICQLHRICMCFEKFFSILSPRPIATAPREPIALNPDEQSALHEVVSGLLEQAANSVDDFQM